MRFPCIVVLLFMAVGCVMSPTGSKQNQTVDAGEPDSDPQNDLGVGADTDLGLESGVPYPLPGVGSGQSAWWLMRWEENDQRPEMERCVNPNPQFAIVATDTEEMEQTITTRFVRSEACMYWGGNNQSDIRYHLSTTSSPIGSLLSARGFTIAMRDNTSLFIGAVGDERRWEFTGTANDNNATYAGFTSDWNRGFPIATTEIIEGNYTIGEIRDDFTTISTDPLSLVIFGTANDRKTSTNGEVVDAWVARFAFRRVLIDGKVVQYVSTSYTDINYTTCDEFWYEAGVGPLFSVAYGVADFDDCLSILAADDPAALADPTPHINARVRETYTNTAGAVVFRSGGYGRRIDYCIGDDCRVQ